MISGVDVLKWLILGCLVAYPLILISIAVAYLFEIRISRLVSSKKGMIQWHRRL